MKQEKGGLTINRSQQKLTGGAGDNDFGRKMKRQIRLLTIFFALAFVCGTITAEAQVAAGGNYKLDQAAVAAGGGQNSAGGIFSLDGTLGQSTAGTRSSNPPFDVKVGFWTAPQSMTTAASVTIGGRVLTSEGRGIRNVRVTMTDMNGGTRTVLTGTFGYYRFAEVSAGETYIFSIFAKRFVFSLNTQVRSITADTDDINFIADILAETK